MAADITSNIKVFGCKGGECMLKFKCQKYKRESKYKLDPMYVYDNRVGKFVCPFFEELKENDHIANISETIK